MAATARRQRCSALTGLATAAAICVVIQLLLSPNAAAAVGDRVRLTLPEPGQLAAARLEFNVKGEKKPKLRLKAKNTGALPPGTVVAAQMARSTQKRGRAVALVAIASPAGSGTPRGPERVTSDSVLIDVQAAGRGQQITSIALENAPSATRNFLSVIGAEPLQERELAQQVFDLPESEIPDDSLGRLDLARAAEPMDLDFTRPAEIVFPRKGL